MKVVISSGHGLHIRGAAGSPIPPYLDEVDEARKVVEEVAEVLRSMDVDVITYHDNVSTTQSENLDRIVDFHNAQTRDWDFSVHFNAYETTSKPMGCEVLYASSTGEKMARKIVDAICEASGLINRGPKHRGDLAFLNGTECPACLLEVAFVDSSADASIYKSKFNEIADAIGEAISGEEAQPGPTPPPEPEPEPPVPPRPPGPEERRTIAKGDKGADVAELQHKLGVLIADGDFGSITDNWVRGFQSACDLKSDGVVGPMTWEEVDDLHARKEQGQARLPQRLAEEIVKLADASEITDFLWPDRGMTPPGYIPGMALSFAYAMRQFAAGNDAATIMAKAQGSPDKDALAFYEKEFANLGMSNKRAGVDTLRHLFVMMIGLGPRESSARYVEGRDLSADNVQSDTCEAGLFQTSWNIRNGSSAIAPLLPDFWENPNGFLPEFKIDVEATADNLNCYGSGDGIRYQWLSRFCPLFHVMVTGVGMRVLRAHWGPIGRREVTLKKSADDLLKDVQELVEGEEVA